MNKKEAIEKVKTMTVETFFSGTLFVKQQEVIAIIEQIGEPEKPVIPQFVADIIEEYKDSNAPIIDIFTEKNFNKKYNWWLATSPNAYDRTARAWLDGYDVEQEKQYTVMLCNGQSLKKVYRQGDDYLDFKMGYDNFDSFTKQQLEDAGFGWVFDCEGAEVQEVE